MIKFLWPLALAYKSKSGWYASRRVFRKELWIPPLEPTKPSTKYSDPIPVLYTNDPAAAQQWADAHFLNDLPAVVGWDMEVRGELCRSYIRFVINWTNLRVGFV